MSITSLDGVRDSMDKVRNPYLSEGFRPAMHKLSGSREGSIGPSCFCVAGGNRNAGMWLLAHRSSRKVRMCVHGVIERQIEVRRKAALA